MSKAAASCSTWFATVSESTNLADVEPERVQRMAAQLANWRKQVDAHMPGPNPDFAPDTLARSRFEIRPACALESPN